MPEIRNEEIAKAKLVASEGAFARLYIEHGVEVTWAKHPTSTQTDEFVERVLKNNPNPLIYDWGSGEGGKAFSIAAKYPTVRIHGFEFVPEAVDMAREQAEELELSDRVTFEKANVVCLNPAKYEKADGIHEYQCINHIPKEYHTYLAQLMSAFLNPGGLVLRNAFNKRTTNFYGENISQLPNGEYTLRYDPENPHHKGKEKQDGMYCYFSTKIDLVALHSPEFDIEGCDLIEVPHPLIKGRYHWELLMSKK